MAGICISLGLVNLLVWGVTLAAFRHYPLLLGTALLAYGFGLRHAVDADHIAAIDNVTRKLMAQGQRPLGVGPYFSLGHSTIVFGLSAVVAVMASAVKGRFALLENWGTIFGTAVSAVFLLSIAMMNLLVLRALIGSFRQIRAGGTFSDDALNLQLAKRGFFARLFRRLFRLIDHDWQMYPVGFLFGLGFDTATEIGLLGIAAAASKSLPVWTIMLFPALFAAGMALIDTADSMLMLSTYGWAFMKPARKLFYNITITAVSVFVAVAIGLVEVTGLIQSSYNLSGGFWNAVALLNGDTVFGMLGYGMIGIFLLAWIVSVAIYKLRRYDELEVSPSD